MAITGILADFAFVELQSAGGKKLAAISCDRITSTLNEATALWKAVGLTTFSQWAEVYESDAETWQPSSQQRCNVPTRWNKGMEDVVHIFSICSRILNLIIWLHATLRFEVMGDSEIAKATRTALLHAVEFVASTAKSVVLSLPDRFTLLRGVIESGNQLGRLEEWLLPESFFLPVEVAALEKLKRVKLPILECCLDPGSHSCAHKLLRTSQVGATAYRSQHGCLPQEREQFVSGATRMVRSTLLTASPFSNLPLAR